MPDQSSEHVDLLLCTVPRRREVARISPTIEVFPNIGLAYVASSVRAAGYNVLNLDPAVEQESIEEFAREVGRLRPRLLGLCCYTLDMHNAGALAGLVKELSPSTSIVLGGAHPSALPKQTLEECPDFDFVVYGEGEATTVELLRALRGEVALADVAGLVYRDGDTIVQNQARMQLPELDAIPFPSYDGLDLDKYDHFFHWGKGAVLPIHSNRGCPFSCTFCYRTHGRTMRYRSVDNIIAELEHNIETYGRTRFCFTDETFTANRRVTAELCEAIIARGLHHTIEWMAETRVDLVDPDILQLMSRAGCRYLQYGIESGDAETLRIVSKKIELTEVRDAISATHAAGIRTIANWIFGHPYETRERIENSIRFALDVNPTYAQFLLMTPYPGTEIYEMALKGEGELVLLSRDWRHFGKVMEIAMELKNVNRRQLVYLQRLAYMKFYLRPSRILRLFEIVRTINLIKYLFFSLGQALAPGARRRVTNDASAKPLRATREAPSSTHVGEGTVTQLEGATRLP